MLACGWCRIINISSVEGKQANNPAISHYITNKHAIHGIAEYLEGKGWRVGIVTSDTPPKQRAVIFDSFQSRSELDAIVGPPGCMAHGLTLTNADTVLWPGPITSLEIYDQANARIRRTGQTRKQQFLHLAGSPTEKRMYNALIEQQDVQNKLLSLFEDEFA